MTKIETFEKNENQIDDIVGKEWFVAKGNFGIY
jgi:hypothetical protein